MNWTRFRARQIPLRCAALCAVSFSIACTAAEALWTGAAPASYAYDLQRSCFCARDVTRPVRISVSDGQFGSIVYSDSETPADTTWFSDYLTVRRLFQLLHRALAAQPAVFAVEYDPRLGYPQLVSIDYRPAMPDEELRIRVSGLESVSP